MPVIRDIMSKSVVSIRPDATLIDAVKALTKHHLSGAPVVSAQGEVIGFISEPPSSAVPWATSLGPPSGNAARPGCGTLPLP